MAISDHGNFDLAVELAEELISAALVSAVTVPPIPETSVQSPDYTVVPKLTASLTSADCISGSQATVALLGTVTGYVSVTKTALPIALPADPASEMRRIKIVANFKLLARPTVGAVAGVRGLIVSVNGAQVEATVEADPILASYFVQSALVFANLAGGEATYNKAKEKILTQVQETLLMGLKSAVSTLADILAFAEPAGFVFRDVLSTAVTLKLLISITPPDGDAALVSGLTVRRNAFGGAFDLAAIVVSNSHLLGGIVFPALTTALGVPGLVSQQGHPCLLLGRPLPLVIILPFIPAPLPGAPPPTVSLEMVLGQIDASGVRIDFMIRAAAFGGFALVDMRASVSFAITATMVGGALTLALGAPVITTTTDIKFDPMVYVVSVFLGGVPVIASLALLDAFGGGFIDALIRGAILPALTVPTGLLPPLAIPIAGPFTTLTPLVPPQTTEATAPARSAISPAGIPIPLDRVNDLIIRLV